MRPIKNNYCDFLGEELKFGLCKTKLVNKIKAFSFEILEKRNSASEIYCC